MEANLQLVKGTGKRAAYNRQRATLVAGSWRAGGWVDVLLQGGERISWRSGAWKKVEPEVVAVAVPADALGLILAACPLNQRLKAMGVSSEWAAQAANPEVWSHLCTPRSAGAFSAERLIMLLNRAGSHLQLLDIGCDAES